MKIKQTSVIRMISICTVLLGLSSIASAAEIESSIARGGNLDDKWTTVLDTDAPEQAHSLYPADKQYADKPGANWRCKECHGWDYQGADGAYSSGKHSTGIKGINGAAGQSGEAIIATLTGESHGYGDLLADQDLKDLANFVAKGQVDMDQYIDRATQLPKGDAVKGETYFNTVCAKCHGFEGKLPDDMKPFGKQMSNPWEVMHKILNGQPDEQMPALRALDHQITADIMSHMVSLPKE